MSQIVDYSDHDYEKKFWKGKNREYEDLIDRLTVKKMLPSQGAHILEMGAGFGRLCPEYAIRFRKVTLFEYAPNLIAQARERLKNLNHVSFVQGNVYELPFYNEEFDAALMVRVSHHLDNLPAVIERVYPALKPYGVWILEIANKRHFLEVIRYLMKKTTINPFAPETIDRTGKGFYNYHPRTVIKMLKDNGFKIKEVRSVSNFRNAILKRIFSFKFLAWLDMTLQLPLAYLWFGPSIYIKAVKLPNKVPAKIKTPQIQYAKSEIAPQTAVS